MEVNTLDVAILVVLLANVVMGIVRGLVWQVTRLSGLILGLYLGGRFAEVVGGFVSTRITDLPHPTDQIVGFVMVFLAVFLVFATLTHFLRKIIEKLKLKSYDHTFGGIMGAIKGYVYVFLILLVLQAVFIPEPMGSPDPDQPGPAPVEAPSGFLGRMQVRMVDQFSSSRLVPTVDALAGYLKRLFPPPWIDKWDELVLWVDEMADKLRTPEPDIEPREDDRQARARSGSGASSTRRRGAFHVPSQGGLDARLGILVADESGRVDLS